MRSKFMDVSNAKTYSSVTCQTRGQASRLEKPTSPRSRLRTKSPLMHTSKAEAQNVKHQPNPRATTIDDAASKIVVSEEQ